MNEELERKLEQVIIDSESIFEAIKSSTFSADTEAALFRCQKALIKHNLLNGTLLSAYGLFGVIEDGLHFQLHESDKRYLFKPHKAFFSNTHQKP
jgi:hypothetical protein